MIRIRSYTREEIPLKMPLASSISVRGSNSSRRNSKGCSTSRKCYHQGSDCANYTFLYEKSSTVFCLSSFANDCLKVSLQREHRNRNVTSCPHKCVVRFRTCRPHRQKKATKRHQASTMSRPKAGCLRELLSCCCCCCLRPFCTISIR